MSWQELSHLAREFWVVWLFILVGAIAFHVFRPRNKARFEDCAQIPFRGDGEEQDNHG